MLDDLYSLEIARNKKHHEKLHGFWYMGIMTKSCFWVINRSESRDGGMRGGFLRLDVVDHSVG